MDDLGIMILTHSSRHTDLQQCSVNYLTRRYEDPERLKKLPPFEKLDPISEQEYLTGSVSIYRVLLTNGINGVHFQHIGNIKGKGRERAQHAAMLNSTDLLVGYEEYLELWRFRKPLQSIDRITKDIHYVEKEYHHPFFPGLHTVNPISKDHAVISCSAPDAILILNIETGQVAEILRMPQSIYGHNYDLVQEMDLWRHYIGNDYQTTHINSAYPMRDDRRILVSTLIQGAIGVFDLQDRSYKELFRGFVGCHGARVNDAGRIYFADSVTGCLVFLNDDGSITQRFCVNSRWLHDVHHIRGDIYAFSVADLNELHVYNIQTGDLLFRQKFFTCRYSIFNKICIKLPFWVGNSTVFLSYWPI